MRKAYHKILKSCFYNSLVHTRADLGLTQSQKAEQLAMDDRSHINLDHGKNCCSAITPVLYLICCCSDPLGFLGDLKNAIEAENNRAA